MIFSPISPTPPFSPPSISSSDHHRRLAPVSLSSFSPPFRGKTSTLCFSRSNSNSSDFDSSPFRQFFSAAAKILDTFVNSLSKKDVIVEESEIGDGIVEVDVDDWDWERWELHFREIDEQDRLISLLKSQLFNAVAKEDYEDAARLKVAIAATGTKDVVGSVMSLLKNAIEEERYRDAIFVRDHAGAGLVGWWTGFSDDKSDPYGCLIRISAEHGRYVARSYSTRQLTAPASDAPLFEIFVNVNSKGEYKQQAVYLKRKAVSATLPESSTSSTRVSPGDGTPDIFAPVVEDDEDKDDPDSADGFSGFQNVLQDVIPGAKVKVLKVTTPQKVDEALLSKIVEQIIDEEDEDDGWGDENDFDTELDGEDTEDSEEGVPGESDGEKGESVITDAIRDMDMGNQNEILVNVVVKGDVQKLSPTASSRELVRVPAKLKSKGRKSFSFVIQDSGDKLDSESKGQVSPKRKAKALGQLGVDHVMSDLVKSVGGGQKISDKILKEIGDMIRVSISQTQNLQPLSGSTTFSRIDLPAYPDPLNGLYVGSHGPFSSEVIHLKRKYGQWPEDGSSEKPSDLRFYEYVEAVKLTGDPYVPAGQVTFRAKVGNQYQLPHKGIIPEELGVVARYKGQGRLAGPGFKKPRWVDGELLILDGKYIKSGPVVGFVYWAPEYQFLVLFNRLRIQD